MSALRSGATGKAGVGKGAAHKALRALDQAGGSAREQAQVVQRFLDGREATRLSPAARQALLAFLAAQGAPETGQGQAALRAEQGASQKRAKAAHHQAQARVLTLLKTPSTLEERRARHQQVSAWLDAADAELAQAGARLASLATGARLQGGGAAEGELERLLQGARPGDVRPGDVEQVRRWLELPLPAAAKKQGRAR